MNGRGLRRVALTWAAAGVFVIVAIEAAALFTAEPVHWTHLGVGVVTMLAMVAGAVWPGLWVNSLVFAVMVMATADAWLEVLDQPDIWSLSPSLDLGTVMMAALVMPAAGVRTRASRIIGPVMVGAASVASARFDDAELAGRVGGPIAIALVAWVCLEAILRLQTSFRGRMRRLVDQARIDRAVATTVGALGTTDGDRLSSTCESIRSDLGLEAVFLALRVGATGMKIEAGSGDLSMIPTATKFPADWVGWFQRGESTTVRIDGRFTVLEPIVLSGGWIGCCGFVGDGAGAYREVTRAVAGVIGADLAARSDAESLENRLGDRDRLLARAGHQLAGPLQVLRASASESESDVLSRAVDGISEVLEDLTAVARLRSQAGESVKARFDIGQVCREILVSAPLVQEAARKDIVPTLIGIEIESDPGPIGQVVRNLVREALRNAAETVRVSTLMLSGEAVLRVMDDGPERPLDGHTESVGSLVLPDIAAYLGGVIIRRRAEGWNVAEFRIPAVQAS